MMMQEAYALKEQGKVAYVQPYIPGKQPFVLIMQDKWMLNMCIRLSKNNVWSIDFTFKTNVFGLPYTLSMHEMSMVSASHCGTCFAPMTRNLNMNSH